MISVRNPVSRSLAKPVHDRISDAVVRNGLCINDVRPVVVACPEDGKQGSCHLLSVIPAAAPEQVALQQNPETDKTDLSEFSSSDRQSSKLMLLVGILGGAGILCAVVAVYLIRKMK